MEPSLAHVHPLQSQPFEPSKVVQVTPVAWTQLSQVVPKQVVGHAPPPPPPPSPPALSCASCRRVSSSAVVTGRAAGASPSRLPPPPSPKHVHPAQSQL